MSRSTEGWIQKRTRTLRSGKPSTKYIGRIKPAGMEEIYSTPFDKKGTSTEWGTAAHWLAEQRKLLSEGRLIDPRARKWTVVEWAQHWHDSPNRELADNSIRVYQSMFNNDLTPTDFGNMLINDVEDTHVATWLKDMRTNRHWRKGRNLALSTVNVRRTLINAIFTAALAKKVISDNPVKTVKRLRDQPSVIPLDPNGIPTREQIWAWYDRAGEVAPEIQEAIVIAAGTGLRPGELLGMEEAQLTRNKHGRVSEIYVSRQLKLGSPGIQFGRLKTDNSYRRIPVGSLVADAIERHLARYPLAPSEPNGNIILRRSNGEPWSKTLFRNQWLNIRAAVPDLGTVDLDTSVDETSRKWYRFRHYYISGLIEGGASPRMVMERAGHSNSAYTLARYARLWPNADIVAASLSDKALQRDVNGTQDDE